MLISPSVAAVIHPKLTPAPEPFLDVSARENATFDVARPAADVPLS